MVLNYDTKWYLREFEKRYGEKYFDLRSRIKKEEQEKGIKNFSMEFVYVRMYEKLQNGEYPDISKELKTDFEKLPEKHKTTILTKIEKFNNTEDWEIE